VARPHQHRKHGRISRLQMAEHLDLPERCGEMPFRTNRRIMRPTSCAPRTPRMQSREFHGGPYTQMGFDGGLARIE
jgi:hypothetical protein